jgi:sugar/nucleoside kinase (ribokinase family)
MHITACGGANIDTISILECNPKTFEGEFKIGESRKECGGSATNFACASSHLGLKTIFVGCVGKDEEALRVKKNLRKFGVTTSHLQEDRRNPTGQVFIFVTQSGEKVMFSSDGANHFLHFKKVDKKSLGESKLIHVSKTRSDFASDAASFARKRAIPFSFDPGRMAGVGYSKLKLTLKITDFLFPNEREVFLLTGRNPRDGTERLSRVVGLCVTKIGKGGCLLGRDGKVYREKGFPMTPIDTTGAGDIFDASFIFYHLRGEDIFESARFANASAALSTTRIGGMSCFSHSRIERFIQKGL